MNKIYKLFLILIFFLMSGSVFSVDEDNSQVIFDELINMYQLNPDNYEFEILGSYIDMNKISSGNISIKPITQKEPVGIFSIIVNIYKGDKKGGKATESGQVRLKIRKYMDVLVTSDKINRQCLFSNNNVILTRAEITSLNEKPLTDFSELQDYRTKYNLRKGTVLTKSTMELVPDVESGREVSIVYTHGMCRISAQGVILQKGMAGDYVKVKNKSSGKIVLARVVDGSAVAVDP